MNKNSQKIYLFGFLRIKHSSTRCFLKEYEISKIFFINPIFSSHYKVAIKKGLDKDSVIFIWGKKEFPEVENYAKNNCINIVRVEDGFIRSIGLGSNFTRPYSLIFDDIGIYFDSTKPSRLEEILNNHSFYEEILTDADSLHQDILSNKITKYNTAAHRKLNIFTDKLKIFIPGQAEGDASIKYGGGSVTTNLGLVKAVRKNNPNAYIIFKPHPDVSSGNRIGKIDEQTAMKYCDKIVDDISIASILQCVDEVHTITSLVGFEGLLYGKRVVTYGMPFYAGWGLTIDHRVESRRTRKLTLRELIAGAYILYPKYVHPKTLEYCHPRTLIKLLTQQKNDLENSFFYRHGFKRIYFLSTLLKIVYKD
ncbi:MULTISPECIES: capsular polysaccharide export protein, LipB/KpsS family [unclassified Francisella]|uniref:capsular polysaccharide export protein, LipB/KpsS family n=1 Tax=unclassified Francisella TaxID=2610885 RepID=UPI002E30B855|nr:MULTISPECIES: capsule biosynthesis protein [unclassified Francisella]MED7820049.1 capsule biosynthesis protein [Francisella sp. 19S2-4]MED7830869.1 capsule biosynthesis protein [Francisella sp. 19S2-10]